MFDCGFQGPRQVVNLGRLLSNKGLLDLGDPIESYFNHIFDRVI